MSLNLDIAVVYDLECFPNAFTLNAVGLHSDLDLTFEISDQGRDHRRELWAWLNHWQVTATPMVGFNVITYDYPMLHAFWQNPSISVGELKAFSDHIITGGDRFGNVVWQSDRLAPQIDLLKLHHMDNRAKMTSLKALQFAMRSDTIMESPLPFDQPVTREQIDRYVIPYNKHDVAETRKFAHFSIEAIRFRMGLMDTLRGDVLNWSDTKIGGKILESRLGQELCYDEDRAPRQTRRSAIPLNDIIFPYVRFNHPEFSRVLTWMRTQTISEDEVTGSLKTKGVFTGVHATVGGIDFHFGTGGLHASVDAGVYEADADYKIRDIDVASLYPSIAIVNRLYPEHLGERFVDEYANLPKERKEWQARKGKKCVEANAMKLAANGTYGNSNNRYSVFYDPKLTMTITVNGQLMLAMLAEWLLTVPTLQILQANTDGITYRIHRACEAQAVALEQHWERYTHLTLEAAEYDKMWLRDVNNYIARSLDGTLKQKGAYWWPRNFPDDISNAQPPAWHKDFSGQIIIMAAVEHMTRGTDIEEYIYGHDDPFDFMMRAKVDRSSRLMIGDREVQRITRYFVSTNGAAMRKVSPPAGPPGAWKRKNGISDAEYHAVLREVGDAWDERIHTKNKSKYETREMSFEAGFLVTECNRAADFDWESLNYQYYIDAAKKLVIG